MDKLLTIQEVSQRLNVTSHTLRFWEKELEGIIVPLRTNGGQRRYTSEHIFILEEIIKLKYQGMSLNNIKENLGSRFNTHNTNETNNKIDNLADRIAEIVRSALYNFLDKEKLE